MRIKRCKHCWQAKNNREARQASIDDTKGRCRGCRAYLLTLANLELGFCDACYPPHSARHCVVVSGSGQRRPGPITTADDAGTFANCTPVPYGA